MVPITAKKAVADLLAAIRQKGRKELLEHESKQVLAAWGVPVVRTELARDVDEAVRAAREVKYPVVMKVCSPDIVRKSDAKGVKIGLSSELDVRQAFGEILANAAAYNQDAEILGVTVQECLPRAHEAIVGTLRDPSFGATVVFGLSGVWFEILRDISARLAPLSAEEAREMIQEIKGCEVLMGEPQADIDALAEMLQKVGQLAHEFPEISEVEVNPVLVFEKGKGATVVDARIILEGRGCRKTV